MTPVDQTIFGDPHGNCFAACLASITGIPLGDFAPTPPPSNAWLYPIQRFLADRGWTLLYIPNGTDVLFGRFLPTGYHVGGGRSRRGIAHAVVCLDGKMVHDPHPSRAGIEGVERWFLLFPRETP